jgi:hypothetical protein
MCTCAPATSVRRLATLFANGRVRKSTSGDQLKRDPRCCFHLLIGVEGTRKPEPPTCLLSPYKLFEQRILFA